MTNTDISSFLVGSTRSPSLHPLYHVTLLIEVLTIDIRIVPNSIGLAVILEALFVPGAAFPHFEAMGSERTVPKFPT